MTVGIRHPYEDIRLDSQSEVTMAILAMLSTALRHQEMLVLGSPSAILRSAAEQAALAIELMRAHMLADRAEIVVNAGHESYPRLLGTTSPIERAWVLCWHAIAAASRLGGIPSEATTGTQVKEHLHVVHDALKELVPRERQRALVVTVQGKRTSSAHQVRLLRDLTFA